MFVVGLSRNLSRPDPLWRIVTLDGVPSQLSSVQLAVRRQGSPEAYLAPAGWQKDAHWYTPPQAWWDGGRLKVVVGAELSGQLEGEMIALCLRGDNLDGPAETAFFWEEPELQEREPDAPPPSSPRSGTPILDLGLGRAGAPQPDDAAGDDAVRSTLPALAAIAEPADAPSPPDRAPSGELLIVRSRRLQEPAPALLRPAAPVPAAAEPAAVAPPPRRSGWPAAAAAAAGIALLAAAGLGYQWLKPAAHDTAPATPEAARIETPPDPSPEPAQPGPASQLAENPGQADDPSDTPSAGSPETTAPPEAVRPPAEPPPAAIPEPPAEPAAIGQPETQAPTEPAAAPEPSARAESPAPPAAPDPAPDAEVENQIEPPPVQPLVSDQARQLLQQGRDALLAGRVGDADALLRRASEMDRTGSVAMLIAKTLFDPVLQARFGSAATVDPVKAQDYYRRAAGQDKAAEATARLADLKFWARLQKDNPAASAVLQHSP